MAERLKNTLAFDLAPGASVELIHGLETSRPRPLGPDIIFLPSPDLSVVATLTTITLTNNGGTQLAGSVLVEAWHTIERAFDGEQNVDLPVKPYIVVSAESGNAPPIPPFSLANIIIYARQTGSDTTGDGRSIATAYRTFQRAVRDVPEFIPPAVRYTINITGLGDETFPTNYALPAWQGSRGIAFAEDGTGFNVTIIADQQPAAALTPAERTVTITASSANYFTKTISVTDTSQAWAPDSLKGYFASFGDPADPLISVIYGNTNDTLLLTGNDSDPVVLPPGEVMTITEPSARFITSSTEFGFTGGFRISDASSIVIFGVKIDVSDPEAGGLYASNSTLWIERSVLVNASFDCAPRQYYVISCYCPGGFFESRMYLSRGLVETPGRQFSFARPAQTGLLIHSGQVFLGTGVYIDNGLTDQAVGGIMTMSGVLIKGAPEDGVRFIGGQANISGLEVHDCGGNALSFIGPGKHVLQSVAGTGNAGVGVFSTDGVQVEARSMTGTGDQLTFVIDPDAGPIVILTKVGANFDKFSGQQTITIAGATSPANDGTFPAFGAIDADNFMFGNPNGVTEAFAGTWNIDPITVTGANAQQVGDLAPGAWPVAPFNVVDMFGGVNPNATGTGTRLFNK
jgi:hypothetical protein